MSEIAQVVDQIVEGFTKLRSLFDDPSALPFSSIAGDVARLERAMDKKAYIDASFAQACVLADAGRLVGANYPDAYLMEKLGISKGEAYNRLARAKAMFTPPPPPEPDVEEFLDDLFGSDHADPTDEDRAAAEDAARRAAEEEAEQRRRDQEDARQRADAIPAAKQDIIRRELDKLLKAAEGERMRIYSRAMEEAKYRGEKD